MYDRLEPLISTNTVAILIEEIKIHKNYVLIPEGFSYSEIHTNDKELEVPKMKKLSPSAALKVIGFLISALELFIPQPTLNLTHKSKIR